jgi:competence protein ComFC
MDFTCPNCAGRDCGFTFAFSLVQSRGAVREVIHRFKYGRDITLRAPLSRLMRCAFRHPRLHGVPWLLVPVPLHPLKEREREFNQSAELARNLSRLTGLPWLAALRRTRKTDSQAGLSREDRLVNLKGAFALRRPVPDRDVLLIDDVLTTGTTAGECARVLVRDGLARRVAVLTVARA